MQSKAKTVSAYLKELPLERRKAIEVVRKAIKKALPKGYTESMQYGMICWGVPLRVYPEGYLHNPKIPLPYAALASQKQYMSVYLMNIYGDKGAESWFKKEYESTGQKLDMGKSCVRFKKLEQLNLNAVAMAVAKTPVKDLIAMYEKARKRG